VLAFVRLVGEKANKGVRKENITFLRSGEGSELDGEE